MARLDSWDTLEYRGGLFTQVCDIDRLHCMDTWASAGARAWASAGARGLGLERTHLVKAIHAVVDAVTVIHAWETVTKVINTGQLEGATAICWERENKNKDY